MLDLIILWNQSGINHFSTEIAIGLISILTILPGFYCDEVRQLPGSLCRRSGSAAGIRTSQIPISFPWEALVFSFRLIWRFILQLVLAGAAIVLKVLDLFKYELV